MTGCWFATAAARRRKVRTQYRLMKTTVFLESVKRKRMVTTVAQRGRNTKLSSRLLNQDEEDAETEDSSLHGGRIRSFKHERGNWASYVYLPYHPEEEFMELLEDLLSFASAHGAVLTLQEEFHLSLSQTVVLRHHWIQPFAQSLKAGLMHCKRFLCTAGRLRVYCNAERTRTFLGMEVCAGHVQIMDLVHEVDKTMTEFHLDTFYKDPSFHVSLAWCAGDLTGQMKEGCIQGMQSLVDNHEEGPFVLQLDCEELRFRTGNKTFRFPLKP
ncbi:U6 snRNA phosphodiesterase isoform X2 [Gymnodraco acuticeps]|uniref:U6 snRNA phosphodiesterase n=1 Tax=Gymnodraco acuticeps TaxID=8218 RepID=A0A6P8TD06_GYMAC|nr:U6 snRNA phosphodiesterase isoform X2 [Gymnodraco acuticeps]